MASSLLLIGQIFLECDNISMYLCQYTYFCVFELYFLVIVFRRNSVASSPTNAWAGLQSMGGRRLGSSTKDKM